MSDLDLDAIRARADAATPGPWDCERPNQAYRIYELSSQSPQGLNETLAEISGYNASDDSEFIAHAREDVPALVAEVDRLRGIVSDILRVLSWEPDPCPVHPEDDSPDYVTVFGWKVDIGQIRGILTAAGYDLTPKSEAGESDE